MNKPTAKIIKPTEYVNDNTKEQVDDEFNGDNKDTET